MEHKDLWLVIGLTVVLAVAVTLSIVNLTAQQITGNAATDNNNPEDLSYQEILDIGPMLQNLYDTKGNLEIMDAHVVEFRALSSSKNISLKPANSYSETTNMYIRGYKDNIIVYAKNLQTTKVQKIFSTPLTPKKKIINIGTIKTLKNKIPISLEVIDAKKGLFYINIEERKDAYLKVYLLSKSQPSGEQQFNSLGNKSSIIGPVKKGDLIYSYLLYGNRYDKDISFYKSYITKYLNMKIRAPKDDMEQSYVHISMPK